MNFETEEEKEIKKICFSENGYYFASCTEESNTVSIWDLRKQKVIREITLPGDNKVNNIDFDNTGNYLGICSSLPMLYNLKSFEMICDFDKENKNCNNMVFDNDMDFFMSSTTEGIVSAHVLIDN